MDAIRVLFSEAGRHWFESLRADAAQEHRRRRGRRGPAERSQVFEEAWHVLQNQRSPSDAEMFPDGFRALGLGRLVGVPASGQVIGTGSFTLLDGSALRTPGAGVFTAKGENTENPERPRSPGGEGD